MSLTTLILTDNLTFSPKLGLPTPLCVFSEIMSHEAEKKFWWCPELTEMVLPFLDSYSTIQLAKVYSHGKRYNYV